MKESSFVKLIKKNVTIYNWFRIETTTQQGFPDLIGIAPHMDTVFVECKVARNKRITFSPHQISMSIRLDQMSLGCSYILVDDEHAEPLHGARELLYEAKNVVNLQKNMQNVPRLAVGWPSIIKFLQIKHEKSAENREL